MSLIKTWLLDQQRLNDAINAEYTQDQQFVLNDIANEQEQLMQELMSCGRGQRKATSYSA